MWCSLRISFTSTRWRCVPAQLDHRWRPPTSVKTHDTVPPPPPRPDLIQTDAKPKRVLLVDHATVHTSEQPNYPFALTIRTRMGKEYMFAAETAAMRDAWVAQLAAAPYGASEARAQSAHGVSAGASSGVSVSTRGIGGSMFERAKTLVAPWVVALAAAEVAATAAGDDRRQAALDADLLSVSPAAAAAARDAVTEEDVLTVLAQLIGAQEDAREVMAGLIAEKKELEAAGDSLREQLSKFAKTVHSGGSGSGSGAGVAGSGGGGGSAAAAPLRSVTAARDEAQARSELLSGKVDELMREIAALRAAAAKHSSVAGARKAAEDVAAAAAEESSVLRTKLAEAETREARALAAAEFTDVKLRAALAAVDDNERRIYELEALVRGGQMLAGTAAGGAMMPSTSLATTVAAQPPLPPPPPTLQQPPPPTPPIRGPSSAPPEGSPEAEWTPYLREAQRFEREGNYVDAQQQYEVVVASKREAHGAESVAVATAHRDLGRVLSLQRRFDAAEEQYSTAVRLCARLQGEAHPNTACALTDLAAVLREKGNFEAAEQVRARLSLVGLASVRAHPPPPSPIPLPNPTQQYARRAVQSLRASVGPNDVSTATALYNLAGLAKRQLKWTAAEEAYTEALRIFREKLGDHAGETADTFYQIGCLHRKRNDVVAAQESFAAAAGAYELCYGKSDKRVLEASKRAKAMAEKGGARR